MPARKKVSYRRPGYRACGRMVYGDAKKALVIAKGVRRLLNVEIKNFDTQFTFVTLGAPTITQLTNIPRGDTTNERDGAQCKMIGVNLNYFLVANSTTPKTAVRVLLVIDKQTNQAIYLDTDLLADNTVNDNIVSPYNLNNKHRFTVIYDRVHMLSLSTPTVTVRKYIKKELLLRYDDSTPSIADLTQNSLSLMRMTNDVNPPFMTGFIRVRYIDN